MRIAFCLLSSVFCLLPQEKDDRPNILFLLTDDHRPDALGCCGNASIRTPNSRAGPRRSGRARS